MCQAVDPMESLRHKSYSFNLINPSVHPSFPASNIYGLPRDWSKEVLLPAPEDLIAHVGGRGGDTD